MTRYEAKIVVDGKEEKTAEKLQIPKIFKFLKQFTFKERLQKGYQKVNNNGSMSTDLNKVYRDMKETKCNQD